MVCVCITDSVRYLWVPRWYVLFGDAVVDLIMCIFSVLGNCTCTFIGQVD
jgi:hypothetical protein